MWAEPLRVVLPMGLMNAPSPSQSNQRMESTYTPEIEAPDPSGFAAEPLERASYDSIEEIAESIIKEYIESIPDEKRRRLYQDQWQLEMRHYRAIKDPVARCNYLVERMFENVKKLSEAWKTVSNISNQMIEDVNTLKEQV